MLFRKKSKTPQHYVLVKRKCLYCGHVEETVEYANEFTLITTHRCSKLGEGLYVAVGYQIIA